MKFSVKRTAAIFLSVLIIKIASAQDEPKSGRISPKELAIPTSPVFDLMGVAASQVTRTADIKDFKVDWSFKSWKLDPNLAIQSQPIWEVFYNRSSLKKYQETSSFMRMLSSLDISVGTVQNEDKDRRIGFAVKLSLLNKKDPLMAKDLYEDIDPKYAEEEKALNQKLAELQGKLDTMHNILEKPGIRSQLNSVKEQLMTVNLRRRAEVNLRARIYVEENWNAASLTIAGGKIYTYRTDSAGSLLKLRLDRNTGWGCWLNGGFGIGRKILVSGLVRTIFYEEELNFMLQDMATGEQTTRQAIASNNLYTAGINLRYGGPLFTFFFEFIYEQKSLKTAVVALKGVFQSPNGSEVLPSSVKWNIVHPNTFSFGGDWRFGRSVILNYGMRCEFDNAWKFRTFTPVITISCMMR